MYWIRTWLVEIWIVKLLIFVVNSLLINYRKFNYYRFLHCIWLHIVTDTNQAESDTQSVNMVHILNFIKRPAQVLQAKHKVHGFINLKTCNLYFCFNKIDYLEYKLNNLTF